MAPVHAAFSQCVLRTLLVLPSHGIYLRDSLDEARQEYATLDALGADFSLPLHHKAFLLQELFPESFAKVNETFQEAFPAVREVKVHRFHPAALDPSTTEAYSVALVVEELGVDRLIFFSEMSSGMQRFLSFIVHLSFAPPGTVVLIDELESGFGVNCLPAVTDFLLSLAPNCQFIITSHHPYIIEKIPLRQWKIVTRKGSRVRVLDASRIPALREGKSSLDHFTRLMNLPEYEEGIVM